MDFTIFTGGSSDSTAPSWGARRGKGVLKVFWTPQERSFRASDVNLITRDQSGLG